MQPVAALALAVLLPIAAAPAPRVGVGVTVHAPRELTPLTHTGSVARAHPAVVAQGSAYDPDRAFCSDPACAFTRGDVAPLHGVIHPVWGDDRTSARHLWPAPVIVTGSVASHGDPQLATRTDVSAKVRATWREIALDARTGVLTMGLVLTNSSQDTIRGPLSLRVRRIHSELGEPTLLDVAPQPLGGAGVIHLDNALPGGILPPRGSTMPKKIRVHLARLRRHRTVKGIGSGVVHIDAAVLASGILERHE